MNCFCGEGTKGSIGSLFQREGVALRKDLSETESRGEFRMGQTETVGRACGTSRLNIEEAIEVGRCRTV